MSKMDWLENNEWSHQQYRSQNLGASLLLAVIALGPLFGAWKWGEQMYYVAQAERSISVVGYVVQMPARSKESGIRVDIEYEGRSYTVHRPGYNFTTERRMRARETGRVRVYVNPENPAESVLSVGVPPFTWAILGVFASGALMLLGKSAHCFLCYFRGDVE